MSNVGESSDLLLHVLSRRDCFIVRRPIFEQILCTTLSFMREEVYRWHISPELKAVLEREAGRRQLSLSAVLDLAARAWLKEIATQTDDTEAQLRLRLAALQHIGAFASGHTRRSEDAGKTVRKHLQKRYGR